MLPAPWVDKDSPADQQPSFASFSTGGPRLADQLHATGGMISGQSLTGSVHRQSGSLRFCSRGADSTAAASVLGHRSFTVVRHCGRGRAPSFSHTTCVSFASELSFQRNSRWDSSPPEASLSGIPVADL